MQKLTPFRGVERFVSAIRNGQAPSYIDVIATDDGPAALVSGAGGDFVIPVDDGTDITDDSETFRRLGAGSVLVGVVRESITPRVTAYTRVQTLYVVEDFHEREAGIVNADYHGVGEGYVNPTTHNHEHLVRDPDVDIRYLLYGIEE